MMLIEEIYDLVVIGAGPTGLFTALLSEKLGLNVCVVDKAVGSLEVGRADALNARTQEIFELAGILPLLEPHGLKCNTSSTFEAGKFTSRQNHWWTSLKNVQRPNFLMIGQPEIEKALLSKLGTQVRYRSVVEKIEEILDGATSIVKVHLQDRILKCKYAVGADGAKSFVRNHLQIPFEGTRPEMVWAVLDTFLDTDFPICPEIITFQHEGQARISWIPRERGMARFYVLLSDVITQSLAEDEIRKFLAPHKINFVRTEWFSTFEVKERVAGTYFSPKGHIILGGDAAHVHSVNGGQGLNTGISDAFALAWRLHAAIRGMPNVMQSYETERLTSARLIIDVAAKLVRSTLRTAEEYVSLIEKNANYITGIGVTYQANFPAVQGISGGVFNPGWRCPDIRVETFTAGDESEMSRIYSLLDYGKMTILLPSPTADRDYQSLLAGQTWTAWLRLWICEQGREITQAASHKSAMEVTNLGTKLLNLDGSHVNVAPGTAIVIRPDMYVGYVGSEPERYLADLFGGKA